MDRGVEAIDDAEESRALRVQARAVLLKSLAATVVVTAGVMLLP